MAPLDVSMADGELAAFLAKAWTARVATVSPDGWPHVVPLWFIWHEGALLVNTTRGTAPSATSSATPARA
jgi:nitroimidazol reductase NimA-like FMN-containing flavoprotein (pyridoxamine 5'-phosphate oxidase superfamily)